MGAMLGTALFIAMILLAIKVVFFAIAGICYFVSGKYKE